MRRQWHAAEKQAYHAEREAQRARFRVSDLDTSLNEQVRERSESTQRVERMDSDVRMIVEKPYAGRATTRATN